MNNKEKLPLLMVMCGLQGSGKSTKAKKLAEEYDAVILSSDEYRAAYPNASNETIFDKIHIDMNDWLKDGRNIILDSTNCTIKMRRQIFMKLKFQCEKICYIMNTPIEECRRRLEERNNNDYYPKKVPLEVLEKYYQSFECPFYEEGFDEIIVDREIISVNSLAYEGSILNKCEGFDQHNFHHTQDLGAHLKSVFNYIDIYLNTTIGNERYNHKGEKLLLLKAGLFHDVGKLFTQFYIDGDPNAHYYNHANVGAYELLCNTGIYSDFIDEQYDTHKTLNFLFYVNYHMKPYDWQTEKSKERWKRIFGEEKFNNLKLLNQADKGGH